MGLRRVEAAAIAVTLLFLAVTLGYRAGLRRRPADFTVRTTGPETAVSADTAPERDHGALRVNINTADAEELRSLSGIGETLAQRIIDYREEHGPFARIEDITNVSGIGSATFEGLREHICVD